VPVSACLVGTLRVCDPAAGSGAIWFELDNLVRTEARFDSGGPVRFRRPGLRVRPVVHMPAGRRGTMQQVQPRPFSPARAADRLLATASQRLSHSRARAL
jgi:hypothetical protein